MKEVLSGLLWIANTEDAQDIRVVLSEGIAVVIDLACEELPIAYPRDMVYCRFPIVDGTGNPAYLLKAAIDSAASFVDANVPTLVACSGGMSRSPAIAAAAMARLPGMTFDAALETVTRTGPIDVSTALWLDVSALANRRA
ncbi:hypothetical protein Pan216_36330 [Planctomycetes bacterium Pan216]|uniref:Dual specificity phosphatase, catalytic domain n=1 Tax=Kolteria novifilia TaxID=2527975 RepID=A0A518B736_9BACT|nr:hypothetical protein Pan216_36330 [Planctomycetes bacterium Pan216]